MSPTTSLARSLASSGVQMFDRQFIAMADSKGESTEARSCNHKRDLREKEAKQNENRVALVAHLLKEIRSEQDDIGALLNGLRCNQISNTLLRKLLGAHGLDRVERRPADVEAEHVELRKQ